MPGHFGTPFIGFPHLFRRSGLIDGATTAVQEPPLGSNREAACGRHDQEVPKAQRRVLEVDARGGGDSCRVSFG